MKALIAAAATGWLALAASLALAQSVQDVVPEAERQAALERTGVVHWWRNESSGTVRALVVGIVPAEPDRYQTATKP